MRNYKIRLAPECLLFNLQEEQLTSDSSVKSITMVVTTRVCLSMGGVPGQVQPPWEGTPPTLGRYTPIGRNTSGQVHPQAGTLLWAGTPAPCHSSCWDTVNKQTVRIPLECILVFSVMFGKNILTKTFSHRQPL